MIEQVPEFSPYLCFELQSIPGPAMCLLAPEKAMAADSRSYYGGQYRVLDKDMEKWLSQMPGVINRNSQVAVDYSFVVVSKRAMIKDQTKVWVDGPASGFGNRPQTVTFDYNACGRVHFSTYNTEPDGWSTKRRAGQTPVKPIFRRRNDCSNTCFQHRVVRAGTGLTVADRSDRTDECYGPLCADKKRTSFGSDHRDRSKSAAPRRVVVARKLEGIDLFVCLLKLLQRVKRRRFHKREVLFRPQQKIGGSDGEIVRNTEYAACDSVVLPNSG